MLAVVATVGMLAALVAPVSAQGTPSDPPEPLLVDAPGNAWPQPDDLDGAAHLLVEVESGQRIVASNADVRRPVASTVKLLTAYTVVQRADLQDVVTVGDEVRGVTGSGAGVEPGEQWTVEELLDGLLSRSGNDAAEALAVHVGGDREAFLRLMEQDAARLGVAGLELSSPSGLDDSQLLSAADLATIALGVLEDRDLPSLLGRDVVTLPGQPAAESRNELLGTYPGATGMKTGFTSAAGYSFIGSAERDGRALIAVVLGAGEDPDRFETAAELLDHGFDDTRIARVGTSIALSVAGGALDLVVRPRSVTIPTGSDAALAPTLPVRPPADDLRFPVVVDGEQLGSVTVTPTGRPSPLDPGPGQLGRALVDGAYAAMRAAGAAGTL